MIGSSSLLLLKFSPKKSSVTRTSLRFFFMCTINESISAYRPGQLDCKHCNGYLKRKLAFTCAWICLLNPGIEKSSIFLHTGQQNIRNKKVTLSQHEIKFEIEIWYTSNILTRECRRCRGFTVVPFSYWWVRKWRDSNQLSTWLRSVEEGTQFFALYVTKKCLGIQLP